MADYRFDDEVEGSGDLLEKGSRVVVVIVRSFGFALMLLGFAVALRIILEAWGLYVDPTGVERFAAFIEKGSGIDATLAGASDGDAADGAASTVSLAYFFAWFIMLTLLLVIGRLALGAMRTGGELALYDVPFRRLVKELRRGSGRP